MSDITEKLRNEINIGKKHRHDFVMRKFSTTMAVFRILCHFFKLNLTSLSRTTLWRMENKGKFPRRVSLGGNLVGWRWSEISQWIDERQ